jgi:serine/threonine protein kinase
LEVDSAAGAIHRRQTTEVDLATHRVGDSLGLINVIGRGATGTVWRAFDHLSGEDVAVKLLRPDLVRQPKAVTRFLQEREILLKLRHENIVQVRELLSANESLGLVMDLVTGGSLRDYLSRQVTIPSSEAAGLLAQVASALAAAHATDVVHRDLKPDNILLDWTSGEAKARLTDFGIARVLDAPNLTTHEALIGTPNYMAPELINGARPTPAADVYSLGVLLYELVVGRQPFAGGAAVAVLRRHLDDPPHRPPGLPGTVWSVIELCLDKDPARRPPARELVTTLRSLAHLTTGVPALAPPAADHDGFYVPARSPTYQNSAADALDGERRGQAGSPRRRRYVIALVAVIAILAPGLSDAPGLGLLDSRNQASPRPTVTKVVTTPPLAPSASSAPLASPSSAPSRRPSPAASRSTGPVRPSLPTVPPFGPWVCTAHPISGGFRAMPCYAIGQTIRLAGKLQPLILIAAPVTVAVWLEDTLRQKVSGTTTYECKAMLLSLLTESSCGPFDLATPPPHGSHYVVAERWAYLNLDGQVTLSTVQRSGAFSW